MEHRLKSVPLKRRHGSEDQLQIRHGYKDPPLQMRAAALTFVAAAHSIFNSHGDVALS